MKIRYQTWRRYTQIGKIVAIPIGLLLFFRSDNSIVWYGCLIALFVFAGSGALLAILTRAGVIELTHSDADRQTTSYKMSKTVAELEQRQQRGFSDSYYESHGVEPPKQKHPDDKPAA